MTGRRWFLSILAGTPQAATLVLASLLGAGCGPGARLAEDATPMLEWSLEVRNDHWLDVTIHVLHDGQRTRIGEVTATRSRTFILSSRLLGMGHTIQLEAHGVGAPARLTTEAVTVRGGQRVELTLASGLQRWSVGVW